MIAWLLISFFVLLFLGVPIAMSLGLSAMGGILFLGGGSTVTIAQRMFEGMNSFALLAIPLYLSLIHIWCWYRSDLPS